MKIKSILKLTAFTAVAVTSSAILISSSYAQTGSTWVASGNNQYSNVSGNVGVGTNSPLGKLDVVGGPINNQNTGGNGFLSYQLKSQDGLAQTFGLSLTNQGNFYLARSYGNFLSSDFTINSSGLIGINFDVTNHPTSAQLEVNGTMKNNPATDTQPNYILRSLSGTSQKYGMAVLNNGNLHFGRSDGTTVTGDLFMNNSGNIGINTYTPSEKLQVNGNLKVNGNIVSDGNICIGKCI